MYDGQVLFKKAYSVLQLQTKVLRLAKLFCHSSLTFHQRVLIFAKLITLENIGAWLLRRENNTRSISLDFNVPTKKTISIRIMYVKFVLSAKMADLISAFCLRNKVSFWILENISSSKFSRLEFSMKESGPILEFLPLSTSTRFCPALPLCCKIWQLHQQLARIIKIRFERIMATQMTFASMGMSKTLTLGYPKSTTVAEMETKLMEKRIARANKEAIK